MEVKASKAGSQTKFYANITVNEYVLRVVLRRIRSRLKPEKISRRLRRKSET